MSDLFTPAPWDVRDIPGAGWQIRGKLMLEGDRLDQIDAFPFWRLPKIPVQAILDPDTGVLSGLFSYEEWVQFETPAFEVMQKANAHLISAAPDLLAALKALVVVTEQTHGTVPPHIYEAIAKAEMADCCRVFPRAPER